jgi:membrane-bound ClpP family serine protease
MIDRPVSDRTEIILSCLFPFTLLVHIAEEYWGGIAFATAPSQMDGANLMPSQFLLLTGVGVVLMLIGLILARIFGFSRFLMIILGAIVLINGTTHTISSAVTQAYNPGTISGLLIWIPLGIVTLMRLKKNMQRRRYYTGLMIGAGIHAIISAIAIGGGALFRK